MEWRISLAHAVRVHGAKAIVYAANAQGKLDFESHELMFMKPIDRTNLDRVIESSYKASEAAFLELTASTSRLKK